MRLALRMPKRIDAWLWEHHGDEYDRLLQRRHDAIDWLRQRGCILFGHQWDYMGPGPYDWDGEGEVFCRRCCWDSDRVRFFKDNPWTPGDAFWQWFGWTFNPRSVYLSDCLCAREYAND